MKTPFTELAEGVWMEEFIEGRFVITNPTGKADCFIHRNGPAPTPPYEVRPSGNIGQEILDQDGTIVCWTTDEEMAIRICHLLIAHKNVMDRKAKK